ncbi:hypothetical protein NNJEOMEG_02839 [Fundidesulfovibrio magnetotacticus]|uniref:DUF218 domain-containing protein n=1 Tax=Fundidesulfovibrio magnetotacticus TaxID=2730080 RepID=A0A6V8LWM3_9BACT|nr:YdcF family protein [Fundidesulfovibrio magnetotacticus]GFK94991.1 hypothetical protein NNJEOMEG_02839 [Fundidesulfovibrio magnetotacticus]
MKPGVKALFHVAEHLLLAGAVIFLGLLVTAGFWLQASDPPATCDALVVLCGNFSRPAYAAELHQLGLAKKVYVGRAYRSRGERLLDESHVPYPRQEETFRALLRKKGVPAEAIEYYGDELLSTAQEAEALAAHLGPGPGSIMVVTSPYHTRRAGMIFRDALPGWDVRVVGAPTERLQPAWWSDQESARMVLLELPKILFYKLGGRFRSGAARG